jgi:hypothetical protein
MPNHVDQTLLVFGPIDQVEAFRAKARGKKPRSGDYAPTLDNPNPTNYTSPSDWEAEPESPICFNALMPLPPEYSQVPYSRMGTEEIGGYEMEVATWGVKWGPYGIKPTTITSYLVEKADGQKQECSSLEYSFTCAWSPPAKFYQHLFETWPRLIFVIGWGGEGPCKGKALLDSATTTYCVVHDETTGPEYPGDDCTDEEDEKYHIAEGEWLYEFMDDVEARLIDHLKKMYGITDVEQVGVPEIEEPFPEKEEV